MKQDAKDLRSSEGGARKEIRFLPRENVEGDPGPFILRGWMTLKDGITPDPNLAYPLSYINFTLYNFRNFMGKLSIWESYCRLVKSIYKIITSIKIDFVFVLPHLSQKIFLFQSINLFYSNRRFFRTPISKTYI